MTIFNHTSTIQLIISCNVISGVSMVESIRRFIKLETSSAIILMMATIFALLAANSPFRVLYEEILNLNITIVFENFILSKPIFLWVNDGLMTIFFLLIGLELKREIVVGDLNSSKKIMLPILASFGGMLIPALIYISLNYNNEIAMRGWAIATSTDVAFALGILMLLGNRVPGALKIFLISLAIFDDLGAIVIIALFYTESLYKDALYLGGVFVFILFIMNYFNVVSKFCYVLVGTLLWLALLKSGVHATLSGVILAMFIPLSGIDWDGKKTCPLEELSMDIHTPVNFLILPVFAFSNAGISFSNLNISDVLDSIPLGIILGLFVGKQIGVMLFVWLGIKLQLGEMSNGVTWKHIYGVAVLCGVGFTMSLFIGNLAFEQHGSVHVIQDRLGILVGSLLSIIWATIWLLWVCKKRSIQ